MDEQNLYDPFQFAYRKDHSLVQALLYYTLQVTRAFKSNQHSISCFVDIEGAFDKIWRDGMIYKLYHAGLRGRMLFYMKSFLEHRRVRSQVNSHTSQWLDSKISVPQGSVIAPILFIFYVTDMTQNIGCHISYADDLTFWVSRENPLEAEMLVENKLDTLVDWCSEWRMSINLGKTEVLCHHTRNSHASNIVLNGTKVNQVKSKKCLGVFLDEVLTFKDHIDYICDVAFHNLNKVGLLFKGATVEMCIQLYNCFVRPHLERTYPIWCSSRIDMAKVERVQRQALVRASGAFTSIPSNSLEILTHTTPLNLRLKEVLLQEFLRISRRKQDDFLRNLVCELLEDSQFLDHKINSPIHMLKSALRHIKLDFQSVEPFSTLTMSRLMNTPPTLHITDQNFGSSNNRSQQQAQLAREFALDLLARVPVNDPIIFTDGSAIPNPGPSGAAAVCYPKGISSQPTVLSEPASHASTSYHGELFAIKLAIEFCISRLDLHNFRAVHIFSDCQSAMLSVSSSEIHVSHQALIDSIRTSITNLAKQGIHTNIYWIAGHVSLEPNELADKSAKEAASLAKNQACKGLLSSSIAKAEIKNAINIEWQRQWDRGVSGRNVHELLPLIPKKRLVSTQSRKRGAKVLRLISDHSRLKNHMYKLNLSDSPCCQCGRERQTPHHVLMECPDYLDSRQSMFDTIDQAYAILQLPASEPSIDFRTLLVPTHNNKEIRNIIILAVAKFLDNIHVDI